VKSLVKSSKRVHTVEQVALENVNVMPEVPTAPIIVIEGIDGSGKGTQASRLVDSLESAGKSTKLLSFPRYEQTFFGERVSDFLNGRFGELQDLNPFLISLLYAGDRFESKPVIEAAQRECDVLVLDRYVPSNMAHQSAKVTGEDRRKLCEWIDHIEFNIFGLPRPDHVLWLDTPVDVSERLIALKEARSYTDQAADLQEADRTYQQAVREVYQELAEQQEWSVIPVLDGNELRTIDDIASDIAEDVRSFLSKNGY